MAAKRRVSIFGATGRLGTEALRIINTCPADFQLVALTSNYELSRLVVPAEQGRAEMAVSADPEAYLHIKDLLASGPVKAGSGDKAMAEAAAMPADVVLVLTPGMTGLGIALRAVEHAKVIAIADARTLLAGGGLLRDAARRNGVKLCLLSSAAGRLLEILGESTKVKAFEVERIGLVVPDTPADRLNRSELEKLSARDIIGWEPTTGGRSFELADVTHANSCTELLALSWLCPKRPARIEIYRQSSAGPRQPLVAGVFGLADGRTILRAAESTATFNLLRALLLADAEAIGGSAGLDTNIGPSEQAPADLVPVDPNRAALLDEARSTLLQPPGANVVWLAACDVAAAAFIDKSIGFLDIARVVGESLRLAAREGLIGEPSDASEIEAIDLSARALAYGLLDEVC